MLSEYRLTLPALNSATAPSRGAEVLQKAKAQIGFIPSMYANMVHSPGVLETYLDGYAAFRAESGFT